MNTFTGLILASIPLLAGCGGGLRPAAVSSAGVRVEIQRAQKRLVYENGRLNLVQQIVPAKGGDLLVAGKVLCTTDTSGRAAPCTDLPVDLWDLEIVMDSQGGPALIVGSGGWGKPSVAVLDLQGALRWKFDGGNALLDKPVVVQTADATVVLIGERSFELRTGKALAAPVCKCGAVASADFDQDGRRDLLQVRDDNLRIVTGAGVELARTKVGIKHWWEEPVVAGAAMPFVVLSAEEELIVYDHQLQQRRHLRAPGARLPFHAVAAAALEQGLDGSLAVLLQGRGGWGRTILYVYSAQDQLIYQEVLDDSYDSIAAWGAAGPLAFHIGGRGQVWSYRFD